MTKRTSGANRFDEDEIDENDVDPMTGLSTAEMIAIGEEAYALRDDPDAWEDVEFTVDPNVRSVVSVRFRPGEVGIIDRAANAAGVPFSTFIRNAALNAATALDVEAARDALRGARDELDRVLRTLEGQAPPAPAQKPAHTKAKAAPETDASSGAKAAPAGKAGAKAAAGPATTPTKGRRKAA